MNKSHLHPKHHERNSKVETLPVPEAAPGEITFDSLNLHSNLLKGIHSLGFIRPTPIQAQAIPHILAGRDVVGCAQTGTGKTAAFVLPILHRLLQSSIKRNCRALILAPTRELALQSMDHLKALSKFVPLRGTAIFGGVPMSPQIKALEQGVDIISATPGRLLDHIFSGRIDFVDLEVFVLDEVDRMLDMGFLPDMEKIIRLLPPKRQNLVFSATLAPEIKKLVHEILRDPVTVQIGRRLDSGGLWEKFVPQLPINVDFIAEGVGESATHMSVVIGISQFSKTPVVRDIPISR